MPMLSLNRTALRKRVSSLTGYAVLALLPLAASGQMLARPGWAGSGMNLEAWYNHAVLYEIDPHGFHDSKGDGKGDLAGVAKQLDYVHSLGVDAIALTHLSPADGSLPGRLQAIDPAIGTIDDFEDLLREASRDSLRVVVEIDPQQLPDPAALTSVARFWLARGAGGISLHAALASSASTDPQQRSAQLHALSAATKSFAGQRILVADAASDNSRRDGADLILDPTLAHVDQLNAATLRATLEHQASSDGIAPLAMTDGYGFPRSTTRFGDPAAKPVAALLLATRANAQLYFGQEIGMTDKSGTDSLMAWGTPVDPTAKPPKQPIVHGPEVASEDADPDSLLNWYRRLIDLHHGNNVLRSGTDTFLNHDAENSVVWVARKGAVTPLAPAIIVACNLSDKPVTLSLENDIHNLHLRGNFLRTVLRSDHGMGGMDLTAVKLAPYGVYIGELRF
ncbi:alpha-amylase family glycosyl hydrolase [Granulicella arctica]|uniref:Alpha-glucosidase n=1 Tax=Granulicella arctica TaxID=940613 RepID=A0A7Y9TFG0_9BACT|nr:alpha-amylase family glycosyl hydrolase [Granulicella arctica]NYF78309.1 alpha-glucosidase [Granulicella arctica]